MPRFRCIHCGSRYEPRNQIDWGDAWNYFLFCLFLILGLLMCVVGVIPAMFFFGTVANRTHYCVDCGIRLGGG